MTTKVTDLFCKKCSKEVVIMGISLGAIDNNGIERIRKQLEAEGKLVLFNPAPSKPFHCPVCGSELDE